jgi:hypothetical protein
MDSDFSLTNCSTHSERLVVVLSPKGRCPFLAPSRTAYRLGPDEGVGGSGLFIAPSCRGHYRVKATVLLRGKRIDRAMAGFTVLPARGST